MAESEHFKNAMGNYGGVLNVLDELGDNEIPYDKNAPVPKGWQDEPLLLLGEYLEMLKLSEWEKREYRKTALKLVARYGLKEVWESRRHYVAEILYIQRF